MGEIINLLKSLTNLDNQPFEAPERSRRLFEQALAPLSPQSQQQSHKASSSKQDKNPLDTLKKNFGRMKNVEISDNLGFFIVTSSHRPDLAQAKRRAFYDPEMSDRKGERRQYFGRDNHTDQAPILVAPMVPYLYIQVPVNEVGEPMGILEKSEKTTFW